MSEVMLECSHVASGYGDREVLKDVNLTVEEGDFVALIGSNGTGKSTFLKCISGLLPMKRGEMKICGRRQADLKSKERAQLVAVVPQSYNVDYDFYVEDIVLMGRNPYLSLRRRESEKDYEIVKAAMEATNTERFRGRLYNELSGGERQRVILARAIAQQPRIILLDEPTSALDIHHQIEVMELIARLNREENMTVIAVLHDINMAARFCKRIVMLREGLVAADGTPTQVVNRKNMVELYEMKLLIRENPMFQKPEILPIRVVEEERIPTPRHVHVICGGSGAVKLLEELDARGFTVTAGVVNSDSDDCAVCRFLEMERVEIAPFTPVTPTDQQRNLELMRDADAVIVSNVPFGTDNLENLSGLEGVTGNLFLHRNIQSSDFTDGALEKRLREIEASRKVCWYGDHDELLKLLGNTD